MDVWHTKHRHSPAGILLGGMGWLVAVLAMVCLVATWIHVNRRLADVEAKLEPALEDVRRSRERRQDDLTAERERLAATMNDLLKREEDLTLKIKQVEATVAELEPQVKTLTRAAETLRAELESSTQNGEGMSQSVEDLEEDIAELESIRDGLKDVYKRRFLTLDAAYREAKADQDPDRLRDFYEAHQHTVFAPAAAFHAARKLMAADREPDAMRLYNELVRRYQGSVYAREAKEEIARIEAGEPGAGPAESMTFEPYLPHLQEE